MSCNCNNYNNYDEPRFFNDDGFGEFYANNDMYNSNGFVNNNGSFASTCPCNGDYSQYNTFASTNNTCNSCNSGSSFASTNNTCNNQTHVHEFIGSTKFAQQNNARHNHRFAGVTGEAISKGCSHVHEIRTNTDFTNHSHFLRVCTGPAIEVGDGRHIHFVKGVTSCENGHSHEFILGTLIDSPTL